MKSPDWAVNICLCCICVSVSLTIRTDKHAHSLTPVIKGEPETVVCVQCVFVENVNASHEGLMSPMAETTVVEMNLVW